jgi:hypothetical protein
VPKSPNRVASHLGANAFSTTGKISGLQPVLLLLIASPHYQHFSSHISMMLLTLAQQAAVQSTGMV